MCGIFGIIGNGPRSPEAAKNALSTGLRLISHRGPDGTGQWLSDESDICLGHVRLSIVDLDAGSQPMLSNDGRYVIIFNGEIYNYIELRSEIGYGNFRTHSDTEVILCAYEKWGPACVERFRGMFAIAIWDNQEKKLFLSRDRFGIKPLYWTLASSGLYFSSEIKALIPFLSERKVNKSALSDYFSFQYCIGTKTLLEGVYQFPAAHWAVVRPGASPTPKKYWEVHYNIDYDHTERWFIQRLEEILTESMSFHLRADVEIGAYVSGGIDSSLLAAIARENVTTKKFNVFNGRFDISVDFDESYYAQALADQSDMQLHIVDISEQDFVDNISKVIWHLDQPTAGPGSFPQYMVSREVGKYLKVVIGGQGGDEIFGGYARYMIAYFEQCIKGAIEGTLYNGNYLVTYESIIPNLQILNQYKPLLKEFWADGLFNERDERYWRLINRSNNFQDILVPESINIAETFEEFKSVFWGDNVGKESYFDLMSHFDFKTLLPALLQVEDRMSMAHGIESRVPFLDHPLIEFAATIPADIKFMNGELKRLLKISFSHKLPTEILNRKDKMGFPVPLNYWLKRGGRARDFIGDTMGSQKAKTRSYLSCDMSIDRLIDTQSPYGRNLWALLSLELWHQQFVD